MPELAAAIAVATLFLGCRSPQNMTQQFDVRSVFLKEARAQGLEVRRTLPDGRIVLAVNGEETTVSLENLSKNVKRDGDPEAVRRFVATIREAAEDLPPWPQARSRVRFQLERADHEFEDVVRETVTGDIVRVLVYVDPEERRIRWLTPDDLKEWGVSRSDAERAAGENMTALLARTKISVDPIDRHRLANFDSDSVFKAALVLSPGFKEAVRKKVGWPVYAVVPCRDFAYFFSVKDRDLISRMGEVVVREYRESGYPLTTEVLEISDAGVKAVGAFPSGE